MPVQLTCTYSECRKVFSRPPSRVPDGDPFCSTKCMGDHRRQGIEQRTCEFCGGRFTPHRQNQDTARFCSRKCLNDAADAERETIECPGCGTTHEVRPCDLRSTRSKMRYCPNCRESAPSQRGRPASAPKVELPCSNPECPKTVIRYASEVGKTGRVFCDAECRKAGKARVSAKPFVACSREGCDVVFQPTTKNTEGKFHSVECYHLHRAAQKVERACTGCGAKFMARASDPDVYHSWQCYQDHRGTPANTRKRRQDGYVLIWAPGHPEAQATGWAMEHRVLVSDLLGRALGPREEVHHVNTRRDDNRIDGPLRLHGNHLRSGNLELWERSQPAGGRVGDRLVEAQAIFEQLGYTITPPT